MSDPTPQARRRMRGHVIGQGGRWLAEWSLRLILIVGALWIIDLLVSRLWVMVLPVLLSLLLVSVLWPITDWLRRHRVPPAAASGLTLLLLAGVGAGMVTMVATSVIDQSGELADKATQGLRQVQDWLTGPPVNLQPDQISGAIDSLVGRVQSSADRLAVGVFSGVSTAASMLFTLMLVVMLSFLFLKDGPKFLPWLKRTSGSPSAAHIGEVSSRMWGTLGGFIRTQALVSFIDAFFIGLGLVIMGVPLALPLALITFFAGFIPILGAFVAGGLAVLVALVANGPTTALIVFIIILVVQQLEGNVLSPILQGKSMELHPAVVLLAVATGGGLWGIMGAFLAVPVAAMIAVVLRYLNEQISLHAEEAYLDEQLDAEEQIAASIARSRTGTRGLADRLPFRRRGQGAGTAEDTDSSTGSAPYRHAEPATEPDPGVGPDAAPTDASDEDGPEPGGR